MDTPSRFNELSLFTGGGGGLLASHLLGWTPVCAVEWEQAAQQVLIRRQRDGSLPAFPIWDDVQTFDATPWRGRVDVVTAGFPCQPHSVAGSRGGASDDRDMWPHTARTIGELGPSLVVLENVRGLVVGAEPYAGRVIGALSDMGYSAAWGLAGAGHFGAPHLRERWFCVALRDASARARWGAWARGWLDRQIRVAEGADGIQARVMGDAHGSLERSDRAPSDACGGAVRQPRPDRRDLALRHGRVLAEGVRDAVDAANAHYPGREEQRLTITGIEEHRAAQWSGPWAAEPAVGRVAHGMADRVARLKILGNGIVPQQMALMVVTLLITLAEASDEAHD